MWRVFFTPFSKGMPLIFYPRERGRVESGAVRARGTKGGILFPKRKTPFEFTQEKCARESTSDP